MKNHSSSRANKGKTAYRTPSRLRPLVPGKKNSHNFVPGSSVDQPVSKYAGRFHFLKKKNG